MTAAHQPDLPFGLVDLQPNVVFSPTHPQFFSASVPTPDVTPPMTRLNTPPLKLPNISSIFEKTVSSAPIYSFDEKTFARRLTRAALEKGFQLLSTAHARPVALNYVFKLSLPYLSLEQLRLRFKSVLSRGIGEDPDWWDVPFIQLGGAGTHYPQRDAGGRVIPLKNSWTVRQIGSLDKRLARLERVADGRYRDLDGVDLDGLDGEWFDAHDVHGYLEEQYACTLDSKSSFSTCILEEDNSESQPGLSSLLPEDNSASQRISKEESSPSLVHGSTNSSISSTTTMDSVISSYSVDTTSQFGLNLSYHPAPTTSFHGEFPRLVDYDISYDQTLGLDLAPGFDYGFAGGSGLDTEAMEMGINMSGESMELLPVVRQKRKKSAWVDVSRLIDGQYYPPMLLCKLKHCFAHSCCRNHQSWHLSRASARV